MRKNSSLMNKIGATFGIVAIASLVACGGGGGSGSASSTASTTPVQSATQVIDVPAGAAFTVSGSSSTSTYLLKTMAWTPTATGAAPATTLLNLQNVDCANTLKDDKVGPYSSTSNWSCQATGIAPSNITAPVEYLFTLNSADTNSSTYASRLILRVSPILDATGAVATPLVTITSVAAVTSGGAASANCVGLTPDGKVPTTPYSYQWLVTDPVGVAIPSSNANTQDVTYIAPVLASGAANTSLTLTCRVTDSAQKTTVATKAVNIIAPAVGSTSANAGQSQTVNTGSIVMLNGSQSKYYTADNIVGTNTIYALWTQKTGTAVAINNSTALNADFVAPAIATAQEVLTFNLKTASNAAMTAGVSSADVSVVVNPVAWVAPTLTPSSQKVKPGDAVSIELKNNNASSTVYYNWTQVSGAQTVPFGGNGTSKITFFAPNTATADTYVFNATMGATVNPALDPNKFTVDSVVVVDPATITPAVLTIAAAPSTQSVNAKAVVNLTSTTNTGAGAQVYYQWVQKSGAAVVLGASTTSGASFIAPDVLTAADYTFSVFASYQPITVTNVGTESSAVNVHVVPTTVAVTPEANLTISIDKPAQNIAINTAVTMVATSSKLPTDPVVYYQWTQVSGPAIVAMGGATSSTMGFTPTVAGTYVFSVVTSYAPITALNVGVGTNNATVTATP